MSDIFTGTLCHFQLDKNPKKEFSFLISGEFTADCQAAGTQNVAKLLPVSAMTTVAANGATVAVKVHDHSEPPQMTENEHCMRELSKTSTKKDASNEWALTSGVRQ